MGKEKDTGNRPQEAQRCLKMAANRVGSVYRGAADYPTCTELNKTSSILFNRLCIKYSAPLRGAVSGAVRYEQNSRCCSIGLRLCVASSCQHLLS